MGRTYVAASWCQGLRKILTAGREGRVRSVAILRPAVRILSLRDP